MVMSKDRNGCSLHRIQQLSSFDVASLQMVPGLDAVSGAAMIDTQRYWAEACIASPEMNFMSGNKCKAGLKIKTSLYSVEVFQITFLGKDFVFLQFRRSFLLSVLSRLVTIDSDNCLGPNRLYAII